MLRPVEEMLCLPFVRDGFLEVDNRFTTAQLDRATKLQARDR